MTKGILLLPKVTNMTLEKLLKKMRFISVIYFFFLLLFVSTDRCGCLHKKKSPGCSTILYKCSESHVLLDTVQPKC